VETGEAVVSRDDDASSCSQAQSSVEGALYSVVASEGRDADQSVRAGESNLPRQNPSPIHSSFLRHRATTALKIRCAAAALEPWCTAETAPEPRFTAVAALEPRCVAAAAAAAALVSCHRTSS
jgi:hypothetical protein